MVSVPPPPSSRLCIGVTGHREGNRSFAANHEAVAAMLAQVCDLIDAAVTREAPGSGGILPTRLHTLLADGADQLMAGLARDRGWEIVAPLPYGEPLNLAINSHPGDLADAVALARGEAATDPAVEQNAAALRRWYGEAGIFALADDDAAVEALFHRFLEDPGDVARAQAFAERSSERVALAGRVMIEQSDILVAVWDGTSLSRVGGTGHTIACALASGSPVIRIDPASPGSWHVLRTPEALLAPASNDGREQAVGQLVRAGLRPGEGGALEAGARALGREAWHARSSRLSTSYRRIEALFGGEGRPFRSLEEHYETPEEIAGGTAAPLLAAARALPGLDGAYVDRIASELLRRFAWADGISTRLSDSYRGGMVANFALSALAIAAGIAYQPFATDSDKWVFALVEFLLLVAILAITSIGVRKRLHRRWFETRRVAEYFRHAPILQLLGVARPAGRWPKGIHTSWPEYYARMGLREPGLPRVTVTGEYLRRALAALLDAHVVAQHAYHVGKAKRLAHVHHMLDRVSERLFLLAVVSVMAYLLLKLGAVAGIVPPEWPHATSKTFTFLGVCFPTFGAAIAGMRYFGDFERFSTISQVTAEKLDGIHQRIEVLLSGESVDPGYGQVSELAHAMDEIVVSEIENWQAVFGGKHIAVPV